MKPVTTIDDPRYVKAMSHPLRVRILAMLGERAASPRELSGLLGASLGTTAYHVRTLHALELIELVRETRVRGAVEHHYRATARPRVDDDAWGRAPVVAKQAAIGSTLQIVDEYARASAAVGGFDRAEAHLTRTQVQLDDRGFEQLARACAKFLEEVVKIEGVAAKRIAKDPHADGVTAASVILMAFESARLTDREPADEQGDGHLALSARAPVRLSR